MKESRFGYALVERSGDQRFANRVGLGSVTLPVTGPVGAGRQLLRKVNSSAARFLRFRSGATTARSSGRSIVVSPTSSERHAPQSQASRLTPVSPALAAVSSDWNESR